MLVVEETENKRLNFITIVVNYRLNKRFIHGLLHAFSKRFLAILSVDSTDTFLVAVLNEQFLLRLIYSQFRFVFLHTTKHKAG